MGVRDRAVSSSLVMVAMAAAAAPYAQVMEDMRRQGRSQECVFSIVGGANHINFYKILIKI